MLAFDPLHPDVRRDPYPYYDRLRETDPVHWAPGYWLVTRYADAVTVTKDARFGRGADYLQSRGVRPGPLRTLQDGWMMFLNPPDHTRLKSLVSRAFTPRSVESQRTRIAQLVDSMLDEVRGDRMEVVEDLAHPLPVRVICDMLGVPAADSAMFRDWSTDLAQTTEPVLTPEVIARGEDAAVALSDYLDELVSDHRRSPQGDMMSAMIAAEESGDRLDAQELLSMCSLLLIAGHETTTSLIATGLLTLLRHPSELSALREDPSLLPAAIEEILRYEGPVQQTGRLAMEDVDLGGTLVRKGERVSVLLGAANRDPARFAEPSRFDIRRTDNRTVAFGGGIHFCTGAQLARVEGQEAIGAVLRRYPNMRLDGEPVWRETFNLRGLDLLPVASSS